VHSRNRLFFRCLNPLNHVALEVGDIEEVLPF
jgi:hypothetical protein